MCDAPNSLGCTGPSWPVQHLQETHLSPGSFRPQFYQRKNKKKLETNRKGEQKVGLLWATFTSIFLTLYQTPVLGVNLSKSNLHFPELQRRGWGSPQLCTHPGLCYHHRVQAQHKASVSLMQLDQSTLLPFITVRNASVPIAHKQTQTLILLVT